MVPEEWPSSSLGIAQARMPWTKKGLAASTASPFLIPAKNLSENLTGVGEGIAFAYP